MFLALIKTGNSRLWEAGIFEAKKIETLIEGFFNFFVEYFSLLNICCKNIGLNNNPLNH
ncbi:MAG: hypothetical protein WCY82_07130 [Desulfotomaculaceae bacterium]